LQKIRYFFWSCTKVIREKKIKVNDTRVDAAYKVEEADQIEIFTDLQNRRENQKKTPHLSKNKLRDFSSWIIYEDENMVAINKPSGLASQGGSGIDISVDNFISERKWQLVHRLDKDTSGILMMAKNAKAAELLTNSFKEKTIKKTYLALVRGVPKKTEGVINIPLRKKLLGKNEKVYPDLAEGKEAITEFKILEEFGDYALLELRPLTGRTHQLRVHCKEIGHAILNDVKYGGRDVIRKDISKRLCLHAYQIQLDDYFGKVLKIDTDLPDFLHNVG